MPTTKPTDKIKMTIVAGKPKLRILLADFPCLGFDGEPGFIPANFSWDGASVPLPFRWFFPRHDFPEESCEHDWLCRHATNKAERKIADQRFRSGVGAKLLKRRALVSAKKYSLKRIFGRAQSFLIRDCAYAGVRIGAFFGFGSNF